MSNDMTHNGRADKACATGNENFHEYCTRTLALLERGGIAWRLVRPNSRASVKSALSIESFWHSVAYMSQRGQALRLATKAQ
ncbi:hypothetical protein D3C76_1624590 [compost metagenome]